jgi:UDP-N-acetylmuramoyl-L-alanyl-D-glutamate--2,6-diaminopimelate ligase
MKLSQLLSRAKISFEFLEHDPEITGVALDSRAVKPGFVFVAVQGVPLPSRPPLDGHNFIPKALENGAVAIVGTREDLTLEIPYIRVQNDRQAVADLSQAFYRFPGRKLELIGITGSKGKTTTTVLTHHLLEHSGLKVGRISTVGIRYNAVDEFLPGHFTTPEAPAVQELLAKFVGAGCTHAVLEISSHALELERVRGLEFAVGTWVNFIADDHLDLHGTRDNYFLAKRKLLEHSRFGVLNRDDATYPQLTMPHWSYGTNADWQMLESRETIAGLEMNVQSPLGMFETRVPMIGVFNGSNALAAMAMATKMGLNLEQIKTGLESFPGVPGRMQIIQSQPFRVINDFAHTEASLKIALETLRPTTTGRIILVVGAAGERDVSRRTGIARAAALNADFTVFTEEDHRSESLESILETMKVEAQVHNGNFVLEPDRRTAIRIALETAIPGDTVLLAGKGHERTLERGLKVLPWDENLEARAILKTL